jgi:hypothetical protein
VRRLTALALVTYSRQSDPYPSATTSSLTGVGGWRAQPRVTGSVEPRSLRYILPVKEVIERARPGWCSGEVKKVSVGLVRRDPPLA